jgi:predicted RNA-binding protein YlxR (DUF448 family)
MFKGEGPIRTCVGCRQARPRDELVRLGRNADGSVVVDGRGTMPGRGAWVCGAVACVERGVRRDRLARAFRKSCEVSPGLATAVLAAARAGDAVVRAPVE